MQFLLSLAGSLAPLQRCGTPPCSGHSGYFAPGDASGAPRPASLGLKAGLAGAGGGTTTPSTACPGSSLHVPASRPLRPPAVGPDRDAATTPGTLSPGIMSPGSGSRTPPQHVFTREVGMGEQMWPGDELMRQTRRAGARELPSTQEVMREALRTLSMSAMHSDKSTDVREQQTVLREVWHNETVEKKVEVPMIQLHEQIVEIPAILKREQIREITEVRQVEIAREVLKIDYQEKEVMVERLVPEENQRIVEVECELLEESVVEVPEAGSGPAGVEQAAQAALAPAPRQPLPAGLAAMPLASAAPGLGEDDYPGFPADDCPGELPDLSQHHSATAQVLRARPDIFAQLRGRRTKLGVGLARCIKTGMDNRGHQLVRSLGAVAGDAECYDTFAPLFDALLRDHYGCGGGELPSAPPLMSAGVPSGLTSLRPDPSGKYVLSAQVTAARCLAGARFPPAALPEDRRQVEEDLVGALLEMTGPLKGEYYPLDGSSSYASKPSGMSPAEAEELSQAGLLFGPPDSTAALCSGVGRGWPDARGVFASSSSGLSAWINEEEHLRISSVRQGAALQDAFRELAAALEAVEASLARRGGQQFARSDRLGYLTANPVNAGTGLRASVVLRLPLLTADRGHRGALSSWCAAERLYARGALCQGGSVLPGVLELSTRDRLGVSDVEAVNRAVEAAAELVRAERRLEAGQALDLHALPREGEVVLSASPSPPAGSWELAGGELGRLFALALCGEEPAAAPAVALVAPAAQEQVSRAPPAACGAALVATPPLEAKPAGARPAAHGRVAAQERPQAAAPAPASREGAKDAGCLRRELRALLVQK
ncbi:unnamed protein product, partial [Prorocentrum cordatum]